MENYNTNFEEIYLPSVKIKEEKEESEIVEVELEDDSSESHESEQAEEMGSDEEVDEDSYYGEPEEISQQDPETKVVIGSTSCSFTKSKTKKVQLRRCKHCKFLFDSKDLLLIHQTYTHKICADDLQLNAAFKSILCQYEFYSKLMRLMKQNKNLKVYCSTCDKDFDAKHYFALHLIECYHNKNFVCPFCCKKKSCISDLTQHMRNHFFTLASYNCDICNINYFNEWNLISHKAARHNQLRKLIDKVKTEVKSETKVSSPTLYSVLPLPTEPSDMFLNPNILPSSMLTSSDLDANLTSTILANNDIEVATVKTLNHEASSSNVPSLSEIQDVKPNIVKQTDFVVAMQNREDDSAKIMQAAVTAVSQNKSNNLKRRLVYKDGNKVCILSEKDSELLKQKLTNQNLVGSEKFAFIMDGYSKSMKVIKIKPKTDCEPSTSSNNDLAFKSSGFNILTSGEVLSSKPNPESELDNSSEVVTAIDERKILPSGTYPCTKCGLMLAENMYYDHLYCHVYKCPFCSLLICSKNKLELHLGIELDSMITECEFIASSSLLVQINPNYFNTGQDKGGREYYLDKKDLNSKHTCLVCRQNFAHHCHLVRHQLAYRHDIDIYQCATCYKKFSTPELFKFHKKIHKNEHTKCQLCTKSFIDLKSYQRHLYSKHCPNTFGIKCYYCLELKLNEEKLQKHISKNHPDMKYVCSLCNNKYTSEAIFYDHLQDMHNFFRFICSLCGATFSNIALETLHKNSCNYQQNNISYNSM